MSAALSVLRARPYWASFAVTAAMCVLCIVFVDRAVAEWTLTIKTDVRSAFNDIARLSAPEVWIPLFVVGTGVAYALDRMNVEGARRWFHAFAFAAASTILAGIALNVAKFVFGRLRPKAYLADGSYGFDPFSFDYSMNALPSGHTQAAMTFAVVLIFVFPRYDWGFLAFGVLIAVCRVVHTNHWVADVVAGAWLGAMVPIAIAVWMARKGWPVRLGRAEDGLVLRAGRWLLTPPPPPPQRDARDITADRLSRR